MTGSDAILYFSVQDSTNIDPVADTYRSHWTPLTEAFDNASTTERGGVELATDDEVAAGTDTERAITPAGLASLGYKQITVSDSVPTSSDGVDGDIWLEY